MKMDKSMGDMKMDKSMGEKDLVTKYILDATNE